MSDKRHTPGPWKIGRDISFGGRFGGKTIRGSSTVAIAVFGSGRGGANARLIAAAPELLAALRVLTGFAESRDGDTFVREHLKMARAAIEQATNQEVTPCACGDDAVVTCDGRDLCADCHEARQEVTP